MFCAQCGNDLSANATVGTCAQCGRAFDASQFAATSESPWAPAASQTEPTTGAQFPPSNPWHGTPAAPPTAPPAADPWGAAPETPPVSSPWGAPVMTPPTLANYGGVAGFDGQPPTGPPQAPLPAYASSGAAGPAPRRSRTGVAVGAIGMVLLLVVGAIVVRGVQGQSTGASSPDELVSQLQSALTKKDPAAAIALLDPAEVPTLGDLYATTVDQVRSGQDVDIPKSLDALDVHISGLEHTTTPLGSGDRFVKVSFNTGQLDWSTHPEKLPEGVKSRIKADDGVMPEPESGSASIKELRTTSDSGKTIDPFLVLVKTNSRWYISVTLTAGEYAVETLGLSNGEFDDTTQPGPAAASPEAAIRTLLDVGFDAANSGTASSDDAAKTLSGLFPEAQTLAMRVYGASYRDALDKASQEFTRPDPEFDDPSSDGDGLKSMCDGCGLSYRDLKVTTKKQGSQTYAVISALTVEAKFESCRYSEGDNWSSEDDGSYSGEFDFGSEDDPSADGSSSGSGSDTFSPDADDQGSSSDDYVPSSPECGVATTTITWDGHCVTAKYDDPINESTDGNDDEGPACLDEASGPDDLNAGDFGITDVHVVVKQERGGWVIDPVATWFDYGRTALSHLSDPKVKRILRDFD